MPRHSAAAMKSVRPSSPPSRHAKQPRSTATVSRILPPLLDTHAAFARDARNPDRAVRIGANAVGRVSQFGPNATPGEQAVADHLERDELLSVRIGDHERSAAVDQRHAVRPRQAVRNLAEATVRPNQDNVPSPPFT